MPVFDNFVGDLSVNLLAAVLFVVFGVFLSKVVLPWYQAFIYKGVKIDGKWVNNLELETAHYRYDFNLTQKGYLLKGDGNIVKSNAGDKNYVQNFNITGNVWEGFVILNLQSSDQKTLALATGLFYTAERGVRLEGKLVFRRLYNNDVDAENLTLRRQGL